MPSFFRVVAAAVVLVIAMAAPRVAEAHAEPERSNPAAGSTIPRAPDVLEIWFTQELFRREGANTIVVEGPDGRVDDGNVVIDGDDREHLTVGLEANLPAGEYRVSWTSLSAIDGDSAEGEFTFTIDPAAPDSTPDVPADTATPSVTATAGATQGPDATPTGSSSDSGGTSFPAWVLVAGVAILGSAALGAWALLRGDDGSAEA